MSSDVLYKQTPFLYNLTYLQIYNKKRVMTPLRQQLRQTSQRSRQRRVTPCDGVNAQSLSFSLFLALASLSLSLLPSLGMPPPPATL